jgi:hypothetical protein
MRIKNLSNRQIFAKFAKETDEMSLVVLRERILAVADWTLADPALVRKKMENSFMSPDLFLTSMQKIKDAFEFKGVAV